MILIVKANLKKIIFSRRLSMFSSSRDHLPSLKTTIKLHDLPNSVKLENLQDSLKDIKTRKIELEPGFIAQFRNELEAEVFQSLSNKHSNIEV